MSESFYCSDCGCVWRDTPTFWSGYESRCPRCGVFCESDQKAQQRNDNTDRGTLLEFYDEEVERDTEEQEIDVEADADTDADTDAE